MAQWCFIRLMMIGELRRGEKMPGIERRILNLQGQIEVVEQNHGGNRRSLHRNPDWQALNGELAPLREERANLLQESTLEVSGLTPDGDVTIVLKGKDAEEFYDTLEAGDRLEVHFREEAGVLIATEVEPLKGMGERARSTPQATDSSVKDHEEPEEGSDGLEELDGDPKGDALGTQDARDEEL